MPETHSQKFLDRSAKERLRIAIILAGGSGKRAGQSANQVPSQVSHTAEEDLSRKPKQFWPLGEMSVWQHSWLRYARHPQIDRVCLVWPAAYVAEIQQQVRQQEQGYLGSARLAPCDVIAGGEERSDSSLKALEFCQQWQKPGLRIDVFIHDAARPLVSERMINDSIAALEDSRAAVCAIAAQDSLFVCEDKCVARILERQRVMQSQTPQSFELTTLLRAFELHQQKKQLSITDDISLIKQYLPSLKIQIVKGEIFNMKLTHAWDLQILSDFCKLVDKNNLSP